MTVDDVKKALKDEKKLEEIFQFIEGQECMIFKADVFEISDNVIYIPDLDLNGIVTDQPLTEEEIDNLPMYTGRDFLAECNGKRRKFSDIAVK